MKKTIQLLVVSLLIMAMPFAAALGENGLVKSVKYSKEESLNRVDALAEELTQEAVEERINIKLPETIDEAKEKLVDRLGRFVLYTNDGEHVMWGFLGSHYFYGEDNNGKFSYGIYGNNIFAGFYDGKFFSGKYRGEIWKAQGLFGENYSNGRYVTFPIA